MALLGGVGRFLDKYLFGYALGTAAGPSLEPFVQHLANEAWAANRVLPLEAPLAAQLVAEGIWELGRGDSEASETGVASSTFQALVELARKEPEVPLLLSLWRRGLVTEAQVDEALERNSIKPEYREPIKRTREVLLSPSEAANAWQQGFLDEPGAEREAGLQGVNPNRAQIQRELAGLPPGAMDGLTLLRRGIIDEATYRQIVREGHTKVKYTDALLALRQQVLSARDAAELWLRGWIDEGQAKAIGALTGYDAAAMDLLYLNRGRPATPRQVFLGLRRGGKRGGPVTGIDPDYQVAIKNSNIRTEYTNLLWSQRFTYPALFQLNRLIQAGALTVERGKQILWFQGYEQQDIDALAEYWGGGTAEVSAKWADRARTRLFTVVHNEYMDESIGDAEAGPLLTQIGVGAAELATILRLWAAERGVQRLELTPAQIKKAWKAGRYTQELALSELGERGMTPEDAATFLAS